MGTNSSSQSLVQAPKTTGHRISLAVSRHFQNLVTRVRWSHSQAAMGSFPITISKILASLRLITNRALVGSNPLLTSPALVSRPLVDSRDTATHSRLVVSHSLVNRVSLSSLRLTISRALVGSNPLEATSTSKFSVANNLLTVNQALAN